jgi:hypothetical protein
MEKKGKEKNKERDGKVQTIYVGTVHWAASGALAESNNEDQ